MTEPQGGEATTDRPTASRAIAGGKWTLVAFGGSQIIRFACNLALVRLLFDADANFGVIAVANSIVQALQLLSDLGIWVNLVQSRDGEKREYLDTIWTIQVVRGVLLFAIGWALAPVLAAQYPAMPELEQCVRITMLGVLAGAFVPTSFHLAGRMLRLGPVAGIELGSQLAGSVAMIALAPVLQSPVALAIGSPLIVGLRVLLAWILLGGGNRPCWDRGHAAAIFQFGKWVSLATVVFYVTTHADRLLYGKLVTDAQLGVYSIALALAWIPAEITTRLTNAVVFPLLCRSAQDGSDYGAAVRTTRAPALALGGWLFSGVAGGAPAAVALLYPPAFGDAAWIVPILCAGFWFGIVLENSNGCVLLALGQPRWNTVASVAKLVAMCVLLPLGWQGWGFAGAISAYAVADMVRYATLQWACLRNGVGTLGADFAVSARMLVGALACSLPTLLLPHVGVHPAGTCLAVAVVATAVWLPGNVGRLRRLRAAGGAK